MYRCSTQHPLFERHGLAISAFASWLVDICQTRSADFRICHSIYSDEKHMGHRPRMELHLHAKFQFKAFCSFSAINGEK